MTVPFIGYSQKLSTNTLKPISFSKVDGNIIYSFNFYQTRYLYETKLLYDVCVKKNLYKDSIIISQDSIIDNLNIINKSTTILLDTCSVRYDKSVNLNIKQENLINKMQDKINKKNMVVSFLGGTTICLTLFLLLF
jgi:hypothetical protein